MFIGFNLVIIVLIIELILIIIVACYKAQGLAWDACCVSTFC